MPQSTPPTPSDIDELLKRSPVSITLLLQWGEMDALGHLNNVAYFRYVESARIAYLRTIGIEDLDRGAAAAPGVGVILQSVQCRFRRPLKFPDTLTITSRCASVERDRFTLEHQIISREAREVAAIAQGVVVAYDYGARAKASIPSAWRNAIDRVEGSRVV